MATLQNTTIDDINFLKLPSGTTAERPASPATGMIRYNTTINDTEYYDGSTWRPVSDSGVEATGGTIVDTEVSGIPYRIHLFTSTGNTNFIVSKAGEVEYLIVAGGGAGGAGRHAAGGGAGGLITGFTTVTPQTYVITVGVGGTGAPANGSSTHANGSNGGNSSAFGLTAIGGGLGGGHPGPTESGANGGSGGGAAHGNATGGTATQPGSASGGFGNNGTRATDRARCGAGGGAGTAPIAGFGTEGDTYGQGDSGGLGIYLDILPPGYYWAGGGGGSGSPNDGTSDIWMGGHGGLGGGGGGASNGLATGSRGGIGGVGYRHGLNGAQTGDTGACPGGDGGPNTGGGGGGAAGWGAVGNGRGANGGSGIVIVRYRRNLSTSTSPTIIKSRGLIGSTAANPAPNAIDILRLNPGAPSGSYWINWGGTAYLIHCEMGLHGGGWMMVLNYVKGRDKNPDLLTRTTSFPQLGVEYTLNIDESTSTGDPGTWGHIGNALAGAHPWNEYMFYGRTTFHGRVIHFIGNHHRIRDYIRSGTGTMVPFYAEANYNRNGVLYSSASIPLFVDSDRSGYSNQGNAAMTEFPIYGNSTNGNPRAHWGIKGAGNRWEVDDYPGSQGAPSNYDPATIHRIWVR